MARCSGLTVRSACSTSTPDSPNYSDLLAEPLRLGLVPSCAEAGVMGVMPGLIGIQASEAIKLITGIGRCLDGRLLVVDGLSMRFRELTLDGGSRPAADRELIDYRQFCRPESSAMDSINVQRSQCSAGGRR